MDLPNKFAFVDVETTGLSPHYDRIIDIGVVLYEKGEIIHTWQSLINPGRTISPMITSMTGISPSDLEYSPEFYDISSELFNLFEDRVLVAHNAYFDYSFLKQEFKRLGESFNYPYLCTARLSRHLFPKFRSHSLDAIISRYRFQNQNRHRALPDALVLCNFFSYINNTIQPKKVINHLAKLLKRPQLPPNLPIKQIEALPSCPGVYIFYSDKPQPLYIGKSIDIKERVLSHFTSVSTSFSDMQIKRQIKYIEAIPTAGEIEALIKESLLIKSLFPIYNRQLRYQSLLTILKLTKNKQEYLSVQIKKTEYLPVSQLKDIYGIFKSQKQAQKIIRQIADNKKLCYKHLSLEKTKKACFNYHLKKCQGACCGKEPPLKYNFRVLEAFVPYKIQTWPFDSAIVIKEFQEKNHLEAFHVFNEWCYIDTYKSFEEAKEGYQNKTIALKFDRDIYKILKRAISQSKTKIISHIL